MILLAVINDNRINLIEHPFSLQVLYKLISVRKPHGIHQNRFLFLNQKCILARPIQNRILIAMEHLEFPVHVSYPTYVTLYKLSHSSLLIIILRLVSTIHLSFIISFLYGFLRFMLFRYILFVLLFLYIYSFFKRLRSFKFLI